MKKESGRCRTLEALIEHCRLTPVGIALTPRFNPLNPALVRVSADLYLGISFTRLPQRGKLHEASAVAQPKPKLGGRRLLGVYFGSRGNLLESFAFESIAYADDTL